VASKEHKATRQAPYTILVRFSHPVSEICDQTDRQTDILITILRTPSGGGEVMTDYFMVSLDTA